MCIRKLTVSPHVLGEMQIHFLALKQKDSEMSVISIIFACYNFLDFDNKKQSEIVILRSPSDC